MGIRTQLQLQYDSRSKWLLLIQFDCNCIPNKLMFIRVHRVHKNKASWSISEVFQSFLLSCLSAVKQAHQLSVRTLTYTRAPTHYTARLAQRTGHCSHAGSDSCIRCKSGLQPVLTRFEMSFVFPSLSFAFTAAHSISLLSGALHVYDTIHIERDSLV